MPVYALGDAAPVIDSTAYIHPDAVIIGQVRVGPRTSVWPATVLRGDHGSVCIGGLVAVQDGTVVHGNSAGPTTVGDRCVIGHLAHLEGCRVGDDCLIGSGSITMPQAQLADGAMVAAGAVVRRGMTIPSGHVALGVPAHLQEASNQSVNRLSAAVNRHAELADRYRFEMRSMDEAEWRG